MTLFFSIAINSQGQILVEHQIRKKTLLDNKRNALFHWAVNWPMCMGFNSFLA